MAQVLAFEVTIGGISSTVNDLGSIKAAIKATNDELKNGAQIGSDEYKKLIKQLGALKEIEKGVRTETRAQSREYTIAMEGGTRTYRSMSAQLAGMREQFRGLTEQERNADIGKNLIKSIQQLDKELKAIDASMGQFQRNVGDYKQALLGIGDLVTGGLLTGGLLGIMRGVSDFVKGSLSLTADFERQMGILGQVSGAAMQTVQVEGRGAVNALEELEAQALKLGATTEFTAAQVADLEIAYAKLGFSAPEILSLLSTTLDAATFSGSELGRTAEVVGTALRVFGLDASEGGRVVDVMTKSFSSGTLDLDKFGESLAKAGVAGNAVGLSLEEVTALMTTLTDAGFSASVAATGLGKIFVANAKEGLTLDQALEKITESSNDLIAANEAYGASGTVQATVLASQIERTKELTKSLQDSAGYSKDSAAVIRTDLRGAYDNVSSAVEGLQIALGKLQSGAMEKFLNTIADFLTFITGLIDGTGKWANALGGVKDAVLSFIPVLSIYAATIALSSKEMAIQSGVAIGRWVASLRIVSATTKAYTVVQTALNVAMKANPVGLVISAFALLATGLTTLYQRSEKFRAILAGIGELSKEVFRVVAQTIGSFVEAFKKIMDGDIIGGMKDLGKAMLQANPVSMGLKAGADLGNAFRKGFDDSLAGERSLGKVLEKNFGNFSNFLERTKKQVADGIQTNVTNPLNKGLGVTIQDLKNRKKEIEAELEATAIGSARFIQLTNELKKVNTELKRASAGGAADADAKKVRTYYETLTDSVSKLKDQIQNAIAEGKDYSGLLEEYRQKSEEAANAQAEFSTKVEAFLNISRLSEGSLARLSAEVQNLKKELNEADPSQVEELTRQITEAEKKLAEAQKAIDRIRQSASDEALTSVLPADIQGDIDNINKVRQARVLAQQQVVQSEEALSARIQAINLESDLDVLTQRMKLYQEGTEERLKLENEYAEKSRQLQAAALSENLDAEIADIKAARDVRLLALRESVTDEKELAAARAAVMVQADVDILRTRLDMERIGNDERLALQVELADKEVELEKAKADRLLEVRRETNERTARLADFVVQSLGSVASSIDDFQTANFEKRSAQIEAYYQRELEMAEGNDERITQLETERDAKLEALQREQFKRQKRLQIAQALIGAAQAVISTLAAPPGAADILSLGALRAIQVGLVALTTGAQIAKISASSFAEGGYTGKGTGAPDETGHRPVGVVHEDEYVVPKWVMGKAEGKALVARLEEMRLRTSPHSARGLYLNARRGLYATGGLASAAVMPNLPDTAPGVTLQAKLELTEAQINALADTVGRRVFAAIYDGTIAANTETAIFSERRERLINATG